MKNIFTVLAAVLVLHSCGWGNKEKEYRYIETIEETHDGTKEIKEKERTITASNDTLAYIDAQRWFNVSLMPMGKVDPFHVMNRLSFKLYDDKGKDISNINFATRSLIDNEIEKKIALYDARLEALRQEDAMIKEKMKLFNVEKDESFPKTGLAWYTPKSVSEHQDVNDIYCYLKTTKYSSPKLGLVVQYAAKKWLLIEKIIFFIDGKTYDFTPNKVERDHSGERAWEHCGGLIKWKDMFLVWALADAKEAKMKLEGSTYHETKTISAEQIKGIKRSLDLYKAMKGKWMDEPPFAS